MKFPVRFTLLKILAVSAAGIAFYSGTVTVRVVLFGIDGGLFSFLLFACILLSGHLAGGIFLSETPGFALKTAKTKSAGFLSFMLHIKNGARFMSAAAAWLIVLLPILASWAIYNRYGVWRVVFEAFIAAIAYGMALKHSQLAFMQIMGNATVYTGFIVLAVCLEIPYFKSDMTYLRPWLYAASYLFIFTYLILRNQEDIDSNIFDKKHIEKSILPKNLRRFNTLSVCVVFLAVVLFFNLKPVILYMLHILGRFVMVAASGILWLMSLLFPQQEFVPQAGEAPQAFSFFGNAVEPVRPFRNLMYNIAKNFVILYAAYRLLLIAVRRFPALVRKISGLIKKLLSLQKGSAPFENSDYSDEAETVKPVREQRRQVRKRLKGSRKDLKSITDPVDRVRYMYASLLVMLKLAGIRAEKSDTAAEILKKSISSGFILNELVPFTTIYNQVRYGGRIPDKEMLIRAEGLFNGVADEIRRK